MGLIIRSSSIHAAGCYTTTPIAKGTRIVEYTGPLIGKDEADVRYENKPLTYLFGIGDGSTVIDGHGTAMFINHSCDPNCETEEVDGRVWISAIRDIAAGQELAYDYCLYDGDDEEAPCNCGAKQCRGSMYSQEELDRRKRAARRTTAVPTRTTTKKAKNVSGPAKTAKKNKSVSKKPQRKSVPAKPAPLKTSGVTGKGKTSRKK